MKSDSPVEIAAHHRALEFLNVTGYEGAVQPNGFLSVKQLRVGKVPSLSRKNLVQCVPRFFQITIGPEHGENLVTTHTLIRRNREHCKQRKPPSLSGRTCQRDFALLKGETSERVDPKSLVQMTLQ